MPPPHQLTRASWWGGGIFLFLAFVLSLASTRQRAPKSVLDQAFTPAAAPTAPATPNANSAIPLTPAAPAAGTAPGAPGSAPAGTPAPAPAPKP